MEHPFQAWIWPRPASHGLKPLATSTCGQLRSRGVAKRSARRGPPSCRRRAPPPAGHSHRAEGQHRGGRHGLRAGTASLNGKQPRADAELVARLRAAGAVIAGKVGMHELAFGITTNNAVTGAVRNPWDRTRIPGGSSGGSGAVVGARIVPASIGTDTGGSVRVPAALCGVSGFRPTVGRVPALGIAPISLTRDTAGPLAYTIADCALLDEVMTGAKDGRMKLTLQGLRLGVRGVRSGTTWSPQWNRSPNPRSIRCGRPVSNSWMSTCPP
ncbi:amidase domain-containing protein [Ditylenchus destructor]|uniref:Amidase domain-containing protein n=1 Tax=Ditylenchus destructor TaxID=166010 RepID=A0AAD4QTH3_9BILA|nr:amidase domain-containing protein [Ditylenchus destructor]